MGIDGQSLIVALVVVAAAAYLALRLVRFLQGALRGGCGSSCGKCSVGSTSREPLVSLGLPPGGTDHTTSTPR